MGSIFGGGGGNIKTPKAPKPIQLDLGGLENNMISADQAAYNAQDQYMQKYYPALAQGRNNEINQAFQALTGPLNPSLQNTFMNQANMGVTQALGGGNQDFGLGGGSFGGAGAGSSDNQSWGGEGSLARNAAAASVAQEEQGYQDYNRNMFEQLTSMYAPRSFGMTPEDAANVFTFNTQQYNNYLEQQYALQTQTYYANQAQAAQQPSFFDISSRIVSIAAAAY